MLSIMSNINKLKKMKNYCNICDSKNLEFLYEGILKCNDCSHAFADISIDESELKEIYQKNYFFGEEYLDYTKDENIIKKNFQLRLKKLKKYTEFNNKSLLEIGSAYGFFLDMIKNNFKEIAGVEISQDCLDYCEKNYKFKITNFLEFENNFKKNFDIFCLWDVIEHLKDPNKYLQKINHLSSKGSLIALTTGNINSLNSKLFREKWRLIHPPTHLHYFTPNSIKKLLKKNNYKIIHFEHCGYYRSLDFILYKLNLQKYFNFIFKNKIINHNLNIYLNMFDIMYIIAEKE